MNLTDFMSELARLIDEGKSVIAGAAAMAVVYFALHHFGIL